MINVFQEYPNDIESGKNNKEYLLTKFISFLYHSLSVTKEKKASLKLHKNMDSMFDS